MLFLLGSIDAQKGTRDAKEKEEGTRFFSVTSEAKEVF